LSLFLDDTGDTSSSPNARERNLSGVDAFLMIFPEKMRFSVNRPEVVSPVSPRRERPAALTLVLCCRLQKESARECIFRP
jgi:hypothetical protein